MMWVRILLGAPFNSLAVGPRRAVSYTAACKFDSCRGSQFAWLMQSADIFHLKRKSSRFDPEARHRFRLLDAIGRHRQLKPVVFSVRVREQAPIFPRGEIADTQC